jgi:predicted Na+-dependent transporter
MTFVLSLVSILLIPLAVEVMPRIAQRSQRPIMNLIVSILLYIAAPLCTGLWVGQRVPRIAPRVIPPSEFWQPSYLLS